MLELTNLTPINVELTQQDTEELYGGEIKNGPATAAFLAGAAAGGYLWDSAKTNFTNFPSNVAQLSSTAWEAIDTGLSFAGSTTGTGLTLP